MNKILSAHYEKIILAVLLIVFAALLYYQVQVVQQVQNKEVAARVTPVQKPSDYEPVDFSGDRKEDIVAFHKETGSMVLFEDGVIEGYTSLGQLDPNDWFVVGAGDYNGDQKDDLLVRQYSTGTLGYYVCGDTTKWVELGNGVDMQWTVIA